MNAQPPPDDDVARSAADSDLAHRSTMQYREDRPPWACLTAFQGMGDEAIATLRQAMEVVRFAAGDPIIRQGEPGTDMYVLAEGRVRVVHASEGKHTGFDIRLDAPAVFGEMALVTLERRTATVYAETDLECFRLDRAGFQLLVEANPHVTDFLTRTVG